MINFNPFPILETKNLILRKLNHQDAEDLFEMRTDPKVIEHVDSKLDQTKEDTIAYIDKMNKGIGENKWVIWAIEHREAKKVIGSISIWNINLEEETAELGYGLLPSFQGKGLMKEALLKAVEYGFNTMKLKALEAYTEENNTSSIKLLESCNFIETKRVDDEGFFSDRIYHMVVYRLGC